MQNKKIWDYNSIYLVKNENSSSSVFKPLGDLVSKLIMYLLSIGFNNRSWLPPFECLGTASLTKYFKHLMSFLWHSFICLANWYDQSFSTALKCCKIHLWTCKIVLPTYCSKQSHSSTYPTNSVLQFNLPTIVNGFSVKGVVYSMVFTQWEVMEALGKL